MRAYSLALAALLVFTVAIAAGCGEHEGGPPRPGSPPETEERREQGGASTLEDLSGIPDIVERAGRSVVRVGVNCVDERARACAGVGSGWVYDNTGHVVTNNHVVAGGGAQAAERIVVTAFDGRVLPAEVVGRDPRTDLAVLRVDAPDLEPLPLGDLDAVRIGEPVIAIGFALDLGAAPSVTTGVVSAKERAIQEATTSILGTIQTDAAINPGNSGGPLLNRNGEVLGVNTATARGAQGIGLAVGATTVAAVVPELIEHGEVERGFLGIEFEQVTAAMGLEVDDGVLIRNVLAGSPADDAGLQEGDVIVEVGDRGVAAASDLAIALIGRPPGSSVDVAYYRDGEQETASVTLGEPP